MDNLIEMLETPHHQMFIMPAFMEITQNDVRAASYLQDRVTKALAVRLLYDLLGSLAKQLSTFFRGAEKPRRATGHLSRSYVQ